MTDLRTQFRNGNAHVTSSKVTVTVAGRRLTMPRNTFVHPDTCYEALLADGVSTSDASKAMEVIRREDDMPAFLREFDPKGSSAKKAVDRLSRLVAAAGATA